MPQEYQSRLFRRWLHVHERFHAAIRNPASSDKKLNKLCRMRETTQKRFGDVEHRNYTSWVIERRNANG